MMLKKYFRSKTKFGLVLNILTVVLIILLLIPTTRKEIAPLILRPTRFIHQPKEKSDKTALPPEAYNWKLESIEGNSVELASFKNKVVFINFWATWCPPCIAEMPDLQKLYEDYKNEVVFLFVSNQKKQELTDFISRKGYTIPIYYPKSQYPTSLETKSLPTTFVISKKGEIVVHKKGLAQWNGKKMKNILDKLINNE